jgi:glycosyltransferase involved in cell wall biosynthesis
MPRLATLLVEALRGAGLEVETEPWGGRGRSESVTARAREVAADVRRVRRVVRASRPQVVLVETAHDWRCVARDLALAAAIRGGGRRIVLQFHGSHVDRLARGGGRAFKLATSMLLALTDGVLVLSSEEQRLLRAFAPRRRVFVVSNPFVAPAEGAGPAPAAGPRGVPVVLFVARLLTEKGILDTIEAFATVNGTLPSHLFVAGDGPAAAPARELVEARDLGGRVTFAGHLSAEQLLAAYRGAEVFVLPTYHPEGFPTSISEAMSAGLAIVTTRVRGLADHLTEGVNALFVPPRDPAALARALEKLLTDGELRARMAAANRDKVKSFAPGEVVGAYVRALEEIAAG